MEEKFFVDRIASLGGKVYLVGGAVRDRIRGVAAHDRDYCVCGLDEAAFKSAFPDAFRTGRSFPVYRLPIGGGHCEVAFARREWKTGRGYRGFRVDFDPTVKIEEDLYRRDTTINAIAVDLAAGKLIDPFGGAEDIAQKKIRAVSEHFVEDPVRALRAARQAAQFDFAITDETCDLMTKCAAELELEPPERLFNELAIALHVSRPSIFFRSLERADLLRITFPEIWQMIGKTQPKDFHPEGDAFEHTMNLLDEVAKVNPKAIVRFCALVHDIGKGTTPVEMLPHHYGHEVRGVDDLESWNRRMTMPHDWIRAAKFVITEHMRAPRLSRPGKIVDLIMSIRHSGLSVEDFNDIIAVDHRGLPTYLKRAGEILAECLKISGRDCPEGLIGPQIGKWIRAERTKIIQKFNQ